MVLWARIFSDCGFEQLPFHRFVTNATLNFCMRYVFTAELVPTYSICWIDSIEMNREDWKVNASNQKTILEAGKRALAYRKKGFHCSESTFLALNETFNITDPSMVRMVTGFHGGGGTHRTEPGVDMTSLRKLDLLKLQLGIRTVNKS